MANQILRDCKLYVAQYDFSGKMNALALNYGVDTRDDTAFGDDTKSNAAALKTVTFQHEGYFEAGSGSVDEVFFANLGLADKIMTISPQDGAEGDVAYFFKSLQGKYAPGAKIGDMLNFQVSGQGNSLVRGNILCSGTKSVTYESLPQQLGAVSAAQQLFAALHIIAASGTLPTLVVKVQSDNAEAFTTPTDRITFASQDGVNSVWADPVAGAITDDWWRVSYTIGGTTPSFQFIVPMGIL